MSVRAQATGQVPASRPTTAATAPKKPVSPTTDLTPAAGQIVSIPVPHIDCGLSPCDLQPQHITVATPPPVVPVTNIFDRIAWAANLVLAVLGYVGIMLAVSLLRKIERQSRYAEASADAATANAQAALLTAQSIINAERPWILVAVEPTIGVDNSFTLTATNRGRTPARVISVAEQTAIAASEAELPPAPAYGADQPRPIAPVILLPGETMALKVFSREDAKDFSGNDEQFKKIVDWEEKIYIYGNVSYRDLLAAADKQVHETNWCTWYIHGRVKSGLVIAGPLGYNTHT